MNCLLKGNTGSSAVEYNNAKGEKITEAEYLSAAEVFFDGMSALTYTFDWRKLEEIEDADAEEIYTILSEIRSGIIRSNRQVKEEQKLLLFGRRRSLFCKVNLLQSQSSGRLFLHRSCRVHRSWQ